MRKLSILALFALLGGADAAGAQQEEPGRAALIPFVGGGTMGARWESNGGESRLGPGTGIAFGGAFDFRISGTTTVELLGAYTGSDYSLDLGSTRSRGSGDITLVRTAASVLWRLRDNVPGYFSVGAAALYYSPGRKPGTQVEVAPDSLELRPLFDDETEWMPGAHIGAGIDLETEGHTARFDLRLYGHRSTQEVSDAFGTSFEPKLALDFQGYLGYVIRF